MNEIQQARDVFAKWRAAATPTPWSLGFMLGDPHWAIVYAGGFGEVINSRREDNTITADNATLVVGTAGNLDLLDAIDALLAGALAQLEGTNGRLSAVDEPGAIEDAKRIAAAIIAADEWMRA